MRTVALAVLLLAAAPTLARDRERVPLATPVGQAVSCIPLAQVRETRVRDDRTIDWVMTGRRVYRNVLDYPCPQLGFEKRFSYATTLSQLCSTDIVTVLHDTGLPQGASCGLGRFQPVALADPRR